MPVSKGWIILVRADGTIFPDAVAMMSTLPIAAQASATTKNATIVAPTARPTGEAGVSRISSAAGKNCNAMGSRVLVATASGDDMKVSLSAGLQLMQGGIATRPLHKFVVCAILHNAPSFDRDDPIGIANRGKAVGDDQNCWPLRNPAHIALNDVFALIVERTGRLIQDQHLGIRDESTGNRNPLPLPAGKAGAPLADDGVIPIR